MAIGLLMRSTMATTIFRDQDFELTTDDASAFLHPTSNNGDRNFDKRETSRDCVLCKLGINPCCAPNICIKKTLWFDECMEIKVAQTFFP